jgi:hypothetical protein
MFGHAAPTSDIAGQIAVNGLRSRHGHVIMTAAPLAGASNDDAVTLASLTAIAAQHRGHRFVVVVGVQHIEPDERPHPRYVHAILQERSKDEIDKSTVEDPTGRFPFAIPQRFIAGYADLEAGLFMPNPRFEPTFEPELLETTGDQDIVRSRIEPFAGLDQVGDTRSLPPVRAATLDDPMVW